MDLRTFKLQLLLYFLIIFVVIIGTLSHELSHYLTAKYLGYEVKMSYSAIHYEDKNSTNNYDVNSKISLESKLNKNKYLNTFHTFLIKLSGPIQTILVSLFAIITLEIKYRNENDNIKNGFNIFIYILILLALFSLRQPVNLATWVIGYFTNGKFSNTGDEYFISEYLNLPNYFVLVITTFISISVFFRLLFKHISRIYRLKFVFIVLIGGISGYLFWIVFFGKYILP